MSESGKDIATRQVALARVNNEIVIRREEIKVLNAFYKKVVSKILDFSNDNIIKLEGHEKKLIRKISDRRIEVDSFKSLKKHSEEITADINNKSIVLDDIEKSILFLEKKKSSLSESTAKELKEIKVVIYDKEKELKNVNKNLEIKTTSLVKKELERKKIKEEIEEQRGKLKTELEIMSTKMADLRIYEKRIEKKFKKVYPDQIIKLKDNG